MAYSADLSRNPDTWVYYINEMTQAPTYVQDDASRAQDGQASPRHATIKSQAGLLGL